MVSEIQLLELRSDGNCEVLFRHTDNSEEKRILTVAEFNIVVDTARRLWRCKRGE